jgi:beta-lactamase class A
VNPAEQYQAASLIKLPVAMELYKAQELGLIDLGQTIALKEEWLNDDFGTLYHRGAGYELTLQEAVRILLVESDNTALRAIIETNDKVLQLEDRALSSLDIEFSTDENQSIRIGTRAYSSFLKCLYFACYNTKAHSQDMLRYLTQTPFNNRLAAGVDEGVTVAHKIGVFNTQVQSDCGIVYLENNNYVLCIMLVGNDTDTINQTMAELSRLVFDFVQDSERIR